MRLINADKLIYDTITDSEGNTHSVIHKSQIDHAETIEVKHIEHGYWIPQYVSSRGLTNIFSCSICNVTSNTSNKLISCHDKYCKHCGAKMEVVK